MQAHNLDEDSSANLICKSLIGEFEPLLKDSQTESTDLKFFLPFGSKLYYFNNNLSEW